jgi:hypothetical protein
MRRWLIVASALAALGLCACKAPPPATKEYAYPAWGFRISFQTPPQVTDTPAQPDGTARSLNAEADGGGRDFAINAHDAPDNAKTIDELADSAAQLIAKELKAETTVKTYVATTEGVMGRQFDVTVGGRPAARVRVFLAGGHFYVLAAKSDYGLEDPAVDTFLYSFHPAAAATTNATQPS